MDEVIITVQLAGDLSQPPEVEEVRERGVEGSERGSAQPGHSAQVRPEARQLARVLASLTETVAQLSGQFSLLTSRLLGK